MSLESLVDILKHSRARGSGLLIMIALANEVRGSLCKPLCWPGKTWIAKVARLDERTVDRQIPELVAMGEIIVVSNAEVDMLAKQSLDKLSTSNLYILCPGQRESTIARIREWLGGGNLPPRQDAPRHSVQKGGASCRQRGGHPVAHRTGEHAVDPEKKNRREPDLFSLPEWAIPGARAIWQAEGRQHVGEIVQDGDGELRFQSRTIPFSEPTVRTLLGHLEPMLDGPDLVDAEAAEPEPEEQSRL